jgi:predicted TIM-barrel fold metal-dependent hydrolase
MIIDSHAHVVAPPELYAYQANLVASRGAAGRGRHSISDEQIQRTTEPHIERMKSVGTDMQLISPRPYTLMHSMRPPEIVRYWVEATNNLISRQAQLYPEQFRGVAGLPQSPELPIEVAVEELTRAVTELGFVGALINPDPTEGQGDPPPLSDPFWYPLYAKLVELDVPALVHSAACINPRETFHAHFITEESIAILNLADSKVFDEFPDLKLVIAHGGGSVPYQIGRWRAGRFRKGSGRERFDETLRRFYFDTVLYNQESIELLLKIVGVDRCVFGAEMPGAATVQDPDTGRWMDDVKPLVDAIDWLTPEDKNRLFSENALALYSKVGTIPALATS